MKADAKPDTWQPAILLNPEERRQVDNAIRHRDLILDALKGDLHATPPRPGLTNDAIVDLVRRGREPAVDAYTTGTNSGSNDVSKPTEAAVIRDAGYGDGADTWPPVHDPVRRNISDYFAQLAEAAGTIRAATRNRVAVYAAANKANGPVSTLAGDCARCGKTVTGAVGDKLVSSYCGADRKAWERTGYMDRAQFERLTDDELADTIRRTKAAS